MPKTTTNTSSDSENSEESAKRAAAADAADRPIEPEIVGEIPGEEKQFEIDPTKLHGLMVKMVKGLVLRVDEWQKWTIHPNDEWCETTTQALEIVIEKWLGKMATSPEVLLMFNVSVVWILPNLMESMNTIEVPKAEEPKAEAA